MNPNDETLRWQLHGLRQDLPPTRDLWPGIAARLAQAAPMVPAASAKSRRHWLPWAMAASCVLAVGMAWTLHHQQADGVPSMHAGTTLTEKEAVAMTYDYQHALALMGSPSAAADIDPALGELDRSAAVILDAIQDHPGATFLLDRLRRTYEQRLELTQRAVMG